MDCTNICREATFTNPDQINVETIADLLVDLLQIVRNSPKLVCPKFVSLISKQSSWNLDFEGTPWNLNTKGFGAIFFPDEDGIISTQ